MEVAARQPAPWKPGQWFLPPAFDDAGRTAHALKLWRISWGLLGLWTIAAVILVVLQPQTLGERSTSVLVLAALLVPLHELNRRGMTTAAAWIAIVGVLAYVTLRAWQVGGIEAPIRALYVIFTMIAGFLLGWRAAACVGAGCLLAGAWLAVAGGRGTLPPPDFGFPPLAVLVFMALALALSLLLQDMLSRDMRAAMGKVQERVTELRLLHGFARLLEDRRPAIADLPGLLAPMMPSAWLYAECCEARVTYAGMSAATPGWRESPWRMTAPVRTETGEGLIEVIYTEGKPARDEGPFQKEEREVLDSCAQMMASYIDRTLHREGLEQLVATRTQELAAAKDAAEAANRTKSAFLANMSHEIRTPLNAVLGYSQMLLRESVLDGESRARVQTIERSGAHLLGLINDILDLSKVEAGRLEIAPRPFALAHAIEGVAAMFRQQLVDRGIALRVEIAPGVPEVIVADAGRVRQVLVNLIGNAVKFTEAGNITVAASARDAGTSGVRISMSVADTGHGIAPDEMQRLFKAFEQGERGARAGGTGLGLAISKRLAKLMGGDLDVESEVGRGSTFAFTFEAGVPAAVAKEAVEGLAGHSPVSQAPEEPFAPGEPLPARLRAELLQATRSARVERIEALLDEAQREAPVTAKRLRRLADAFEFGALAQSLERGEGA